MLNRNLTMLARGFILFAVITAMLGGISMAQEKPACDRQCLISFADRYLDALIKHDPKQLPIRDGLKFTENGETKPFDEGIWKTATAVKSRQYFADASTGQIAVAGVMDEGGQPVLYAIRLKIEKEKITEIESITARKGDHVLFSPDALMTPRAIYDEVIPTNERTPREKMIAAANSYFDGIEQHSGEKVPFDPACNRIENGAQTTRPLPDGSGTNVREGMKNFTYIKKVRDRRFPIVDEERGVVFSVIMFDMPGEGAIGSSPEPQRRVRSLLLAEIFKIGDGKIKSIDTYMINRQIGAPTGWN